MLFFQCHIFKYVKHFTKIIYAVLKWKWTKHRKNRTSLYLASAVVWLCEMSRNTIRVSYMILFIRGRIHMKRDRNRWLRVPYNWRCSVYVRTSWLSWFKIQLLRNSKLPDQCLVQWQIWKCIKLPIFNAGCSKSNSQV